MASTADVQPFGTMPDGRSVELFVLRDDAVEVRVITLGGIITAIRVPDRAGTPGNIVLAFDSLDGYLADRSYRGAIIGRCANRIGRGHLAVDGQAYALPANDGVHHLHGGPDGFHRHIWAGRLMPFPDGVELCLERTSSDGEGGYPGNLDVCVRYALSRGTLSIEYLATTDAVTVVNLTQHSYFNLRGDGGTVLDHEVTIDADRFTPVLPGLIPTGEQAQVEGTPFDFRVSRRIGARMHAADEQVRRGAGYDHNWILRPAHGALRRAARVRDPESGRTLDISTTQPGLQFYAGGQLEGNRRYTGLCLETQHWPDAPHQPSFPSIVLRPGEHYRELTTWTFGTE